MADGQDGSQEERLFGSCVRDPRLLFTESQLETVLEKVFDLLLDLLRCGMASAHPDEPIVGIAEVFHPAIGWVIHHLRGGCSYLLHDRSERFGFGGSTGHQSVFLPN